MTTTGMDWKMDSQTYGKELAWHINIFRYEPWFLSDGGFYNNNSRLGMATIWGRLLCKLWLLTGQIWYFPVHTHVYTCTHATHMHAHTCMDGLTHIVRTHARTTQRGVYTPIQYTHNYAVKHMIN